MYCGSRRAIAVMQARSKSSTPRRSTPVWSGCWTSRSVRQMRQRPGYSWWPPTQGWTRYAHGARPAFSRLVDIGVRHRPCGERERPPGSMARFGTGVKSTDAAACRLRQDHATRSSVRLAPARALDPRTLGRRRGGRWGWRCSGRRRRCGLRMGAASFTTCKMQGLNVCVIGSLACPTPHCRSFIRRAECADPRSSASRA
jgi:hypothetical protein